MKQKILTLFGVVFSCSHLIAEPAVEAVVEQQELERTDFIRVDEDPTAARLQTAVTSYTKGDVVVDLIGAVHIADQGYYENLNEEFENYESVLFEMVGGDRMVNGQMPKLAPGEKIETLSKLLGKAYTMMENFLALSGQKEYVDYSAENFVHADLSMYEFKRLQKEKGESILGFAMKQQKSEKEPNSIKLLMALVTGNADMAKLELIDTLGQGDDQVAQFAGDSVIIGDRNQKCLDILDVEIASGKKRVGVFYGAAHYPDMEQRLLADGYIKTNHRWMTAWDVKKPEKKVKKAS